MTTRDWIFFIVAMIFWIGVTYLAFLATCDEFDRLGF